MSNYRNNSGYPIQNRGFQQYDTQQYGKRDQNKNIGETLRPVNYDNIAPFRKDFYSPSESAVNRTAEEVKALNAKFEISLIGRESHKYAPIALFSEAGFPDFIMNEIAKQVQHFVFGFILWFKTNLIFVSGLRESYWHPSNRFPNCFVWKESCWDCKNRIRKNVGLYYTRYIIVKFSIFWFYDFFLS